MSSKLSGEWWWEPFPELHRKMAARDFSCEELTRAWLDRMEAIAPRYNALALTLRPQAIKKAKEVDRDFKRGRVRGPLQGIPFGAKDLLSYGGQPTAWGAQPFAGQVFAEHAVAVAKLEKAGAVCMGKLAMVQLAGGGGYRYAAASMTGPGLNPWDRTRWSGGSSSGSGSAVAAGLAGFALGSETWGSIVTPAAYCGVTGLRPTYGMVSRRGAMALSWTMDKIGPMARSAEECAYILAAIAGGDSQDPGSAGKSFYYAPEYVRANKDIRIGYAPGDLELIEDAGVRSAIAAAYEAFRQMGFDMKDVSLKEMPYGTAASVIIGCEATSIFEDLLTSGGIDQLADKNQIAGLRASMDYSARDYLRAMRVRRMAMEEMQKVYMDFDILVAPSRITVATKISEPLDRSAGSTGATRKERGLRDLSAAGNLAGLPAVSIPCGFAEGLPVGLALVGRPFTENVILAAAKRYQDLTDWHKKRPEVKQ